MKIAIVGTNTLNDVELVNKILDDLYAGAEEGWTVLSTGANGFDYHVHKWCSSKGIDSIKFEPYYRLDPKAEFDARHFFIRNKSIVRNADEVVAVWDNESNDIKHLIEYTEKLDKPLTIVRVGDDNE